MEAFEPGTFCGEICVYDAENRVSQPITICIEVLELGGDNSAFLVGTWVLTAVEESNGQIINVGEEDEHQQTFNCPNNQGSVTFTKVFRTEFVTAKFNSDGSATIDGEEYEKELDWDTSTCDQLVYKEKTEAIAMNGIWTYNDDTSQLDMVLQNNEDNEQEVASFLVVQNGSNLELTFISDNETNRLFFSPQ